MQQQITIELAERFVRKISKYTEYNVNIINEMGQIIAASKDTERIGTFHEAAYHMISNHIESMVIRSNEDFAGSRTGVNFLLENAGVTYGVVGLSGNPDEVEPIALVIKMALETMIAYEHQQIMVISRRSAQEQFFVALFLEIPPSKTRIEMLAKQLSYDENCIRVPVFIRTGEALPQDENSLRLRLQTIKDQDLCWKTDDEHLLLFLKLNQTDKPVLSRWRIEIIDRIKSLTSVLNCTSIAVGMPQDRFQYYCKSYSHCRWLEESVSWDSGNEAVFFADHIQSYLSSLLPDLELYTIFNTFERYSGQSFLKLFKETIEMLEKTNYSLTECSKKLFLHKNTVSFRIGRISEILGIQPLHLTADRNFAYWFLYYLFQKQTR